MSNFEQERWRVARELPKLGKGNGDTFFNGVLMAFLERNPQSPHELIDALTHIFQSRKQRAPEDAQSASRADTFVAQIRQNLKDLLQ
ncbi:MAG: hypothetical protein PHS73_01715 [Candidatus Peribacteraceae bacterium]|nr:hypothetical protein [Candidatus Peribacteraceae bacterium]